MVEQQCACRVSNRFHLPLYRCSHPHFLFYYRSSQNHPVTSRPLPHLPPPPSPPSLPFLLFGAKPPIQLAYTSSFKTIATITSPPSPPSPSEIGVYRATCLAATIEGRVARVARGMVVVVTSVAGPRTATEAAPAATNVTARRAAMTAPITTATIAVMIAPVAIATTAAMAATAETTGATGARNAVTAVPTNRRATSYCHRCRSWIVRTWRSRLATSTFFSGKAQPRDRRRRRSRTQWLPMLLVMFMGTRTARHTPSSMAFSTRSGIMPASLSLFR